MDHPGIRTTVHMFIWHSGVLVCVKEVALSWRYEDLCGLNDPASPTGRTAPAVLNKVLCISHLK